MAENGFQMFPGGLDGAFPSALLIESSIVPEPNGFEGAGNGMGLLIAAGPGQVMTLLRDSAQPIEGEGTLLLSVSARASGPGASIFLVGLDSRFDGSMAYAAPQDSDAFVERWRRISVLFDARGGGVLPLLQVANQTENETVIVYLDELRIYKIEDEEMYPGILFGDTD